LLLIYIYIYIIIREGKWGWIRGGEGEGIVLEHFTVFPLLSLTLTSLTLNFPHSLSIILEEE
jgi:hypothetical protein